MNEQKIMPASFHEFALQDMAHSNGERFALAATSRGQRERLALFPQLPALRHLTRRGALLLRLSAGTALRRCRHHARLLRRTRLLGRP